MNVESVTLTLPILGPQTLDLFQPDTHERLDAVDAALDDHHPIAADPDPGPRRRLGHRARGRCSLEHDRVRAVPEHGRAGEAAAAERGRPERRDQAGARRRGRRQAHRDDLDVRRRRRAGERDGRRPGRRDVAALDRLRPLVAGRRSAALRPQAGEADRRPRQLPALGVVPRPAGLPDDLPRLGERRRSSGPPSATHLRPSRARTRRRRRSPSRATRSRSAARPTSAQATRSR